MLNGLSFGIFVLVLILSCNGCLSVAFFHSGLFVIWLTVFWHRYLLNVFLFIVLFSFVFYVHRAVKKALLCACITHQSGFLNSHFY